MKSVRPVSSAVAVAVAAIAVIAARATGPTDRFQYPVLHGRPASGGRKTLYRFFPGKEALADSLVTAKVESITSGLRAIMEDGGAGFSARAHRVLDHVLTELSGVSPIFLRDLQRFAPRIHRRIETVRRSVIPEVWGTLIAEGRNEGLVRAEIDPLFAAELMLQRSRAS